MFKNRPLFNDNSPHHTRNTKNWHRSPKFNQNHNSGYQQTKYDEQRSPPYQRNSPYKVKGSSASDDDEIPTFSGDDKATEELQSGWDKQANTKASGKDEVTSFWSNNSTNNAASWGTDLTSGWDNKKAIDNWKMQRACIP